MLNTTIIKKSKKPLLKTDKIDSGIFLGVEDSNKDKKEFEETMKIVSDVPTADKVKPSKLKETEKPKPTDLVGIELMLNQAKKKKASKGK